MAENEGEFEAWLEFANKLFLGVDGSEADFVGGGVGFFLSRSSDFGDIEEAWEAAGEARG